MSEDFFPVVLKVKPQDNFHVEVYFNDGKIVDYDAGAVLQGEVFANCIREAYRSEFW